MKLNVIRENNLNDSNQNIKQRTEAVLSAIKSLPSIPKAVFEVIKLLNDPKTSTGQLAEVMSKDHGLTAKVLAIANSPLYGIKRKVSSIEFAILVLGFQEIKNIIMALSFVETMKAIPAHYFDPMEFWLHSLVVGTGAKGISQHLGFDFGSEAFVAGLFHDVGVLVIYNYFNPEFKQIIETASSENMSIFEAEKKIMGLSHQEIGKYLAEKWNLPLQLCDAIFYHHNPNECSENKYFVSVIHLVDYMTQRLGIAEFFWDKEILPDNSILETLNFPSEEALDNFIVGYDEMFKVTAESLKI